SRRRHTRFSRDWSSDVCSSDLYWVKLNWTMPAYITGILLAVQYIPLKWVRVQIITSLIFHFAFLIQVLFYPIPIRSDDTWWGWRSEERRVGKECGVRVARDRRR